LRFDQPQSARNGIIWPTKRPRRANEGRARFQEIEMMFHMLPSYRGGMLLIVLE